MRRIRQHLTYANVMATLAVFIALGGTALASVIITSNSQVDRGTISGHHPPSGDHPNIIGGSVDRTDLASGAVTSGKFFLRRVGNLDFGSIAGPSCDSMDVDTPGIRATDNVVVTPPPGYPNTFTLEGRPVPASNAVALVACNTFDGGGSVDPDGNGGFYKILVIR